VETLVWVVHILTTLVLIGLVLMQHGKGADMGAAYGTGSAGSLFGSAGSANFLSRSTAIAAAVFFATSLWLTYSYAHRPQGTSIMDKADLPQTSRPAGTSQPAGNVPQAPAAPVGAAVPTPQKSGEIPK
jgi:preprotein translocase subunit SecG